MPKKTRLTKVEAMSIELTDLRAKVTSRTAAVLAALNHATGKERSQIAREVLDAWACEQIHASRLVTRFSASEGVMGADEGLPQ